LKKVQFADTLETKKCYKIKLYIYNFQHFRLNKEKKKWIFYGFTKRLETLIAE